VPWRFFRYASPSKRYARAKVGPEAIILTLDCNHRLTLFDNLVLVIR
jgi:hypothetical protein